MEGTPQTTDLDRRAITRTDWLLIGVLLALVLPLRVWLICNTEVTARDSIGYIRYALQFERYSWKEVLLKNHQHPGYPVLVWFMSQPVRAIDGETTPENMALSTQLVNFFAALLLMVPMYFLGRQFFDRTVSFWAVILYQYLPISAQHLSDGISEPIFLVLMVSGLLQAVHAVRDRSVVRCGLCGLFAGLAYLTRPEGALILPALMVMLIVMQIVPRLRTTWPRFLACLTASAACAALVGSIYVAATGKITNKPAPDGMLRGKEVASAQGPAQLFAAVVPTGDPRTIRVVNSFRAVAVEVTQGFHYLAGIPLLLGAWWSFAGCRRDPGYWALAAYCLIHGFILIALGTLAGYVSDRHVMILVLLGCFYAVHGMRELPRRLLALAGASGSRWYRSPCLWFGVLMAAMLAFCMPKATQRLHGNRAGNHAAGQWLATQLKVGDHVEDDHAWSVYYSGFIFREGDDPVLPPDHVPTCYVVATLSRNQDWHTHVQTKVVAPDAKVVYVWPDAGDTRTGRVIILAQPRDPGRNPWKTSP